MEVIEISVPYTGTNFLAKLFTDRGFHRVSMVEEVHQKGDILRVAHCIKPTQVDPALRYVKSGLPLVLPCRHPFRVQESYIRKGDGNHVDVMIEAFETLITKFAPLTENILCVDSERLEWQLSRMRRNLGLDLKTYWPVVASKSDTWRADLSEFSPTNDVIDLVDRHKEFFNQFYCGKTSR